ncbi:hypothetical protein TthAA220_13980 [Thermus thermophilus]|nr:hypothetical protein TthAA220_13980 [Thermus thermophilus]
MGQRAFVPAAEGGGVTSQAGLRRHGGPGKKSPGASPGQLGGGEGMKDAAGVFAPLGEAVARDILVAEVGRVRIYV